jgi:endonuclease/exonuclease/phosphatase family metal-dependent hydrolase
LTETRKPIDLRLLTYNVHGLRAGTAAVAEVIASVAPDVAVLQEAPAGVRWRTRCSELARQSGLYVVAGGRPSVGNLLLCSPRVAVETASAGLFSRTPKLPRRGFASAVLVVSGARVGVVGVHLGLNLPERRRHASEIAETVARLRTRGGATVLVAGDLNALPHADALAPVRAELVDVGVRTTPWHTFPARQPTARIDVIFAPLEVTVLSCGVPDVDADDLVHASDHLPVLAVLRLP